MLNSEVEVLKQEVLFSAHRENHLDHHLPRGFPSTEPTASGRRELREREPQRRDERPGDALLSQIIQFLANFKLSCPACHSISYLTLAPLAVVDPENDPLGNQPRH